MRFVRALLLVLVLGLVAGVAGADTKVVQETHTGSMMGQPASDTQTTTWIGKDRMRADTGTGSMIVRLDQQKLYQIDNSAKTYSEVDLPVDLAKIMPPEMAGMAAALQFTITVTPTDETKMVGSWNARRYDMVMKNSMMEMTSKIWATTDVKLDYATVRDMAAAMVSVQPGMEEMVKELAKIDGFQVLMEGSMVIMGNNVETTIKVISIEESGAPAGGYEPPADHTKNDFDLMAAMRK